jgi:hypothetical protein
MEEFWILDLGFWIQLGLPADAYIKFGINATCRPTLNSGFPALGRAESLPVLNPKSQIENPKSLQCSASKNFSVSIAAMHPDPAAVMACR